MCTEDDAQSKDEMPIVIPAMQTYGRIKQILNSLAGMAGITGTNPYKDHFLFFQQLPINDLTTFMAGVEWSKQDIQRRPAYYSALCDCFSRHMGAHIDRGQSVTDLTATSEPPPDTRPKLRLV